MKKDAIFYRPTLPERYAICLALPKFLEFSSFGGKENVFSLCRQK